MEIVKISQRQQNIVMQDNADCPQDSPLPPLYVSRPITRLKSHQVPRGGIQSVTHEEVHYISKELLGFSNLYKEKSEEHVQEWRFKAVE